MLNEKLIGAFISSLRKEKDLTQLELAEKVNVSHQAVSKWERGESLPDIQTLVDVAKLFKVSVDQMLSGGKKGGKFNNVGPVVEKITTNEWNEAAGIINEGKTTTDELISIAPLLKKNVLKDITSNVTSDHFTIDQITQLAPFLDKGALNDLMEKVAFDEVSVDQVVDLAPFINVGSIPKLLESNVSNLTLEHLISLAPFMDKNLDQMLQKKELDIIQVHQIESLAPFVNSNTLVDLLEKCDEPLKFNHLINLAPFLNGHLDRLIDQVNIEKVNCDDLSAIAPFIQEEGMMKLLNLVDKTKFTPEVIVELAPFLSKEILADLISKQGK
jgi:transcriptional regulator with XRE-family HTH domain